MIGHRPSTLAQTERILVLAEGRLQLFGPRAAVIDHLKRQQVQAVQPASSPSPAHRNQVSQSQAAHNQVGQLETAN